MSSSNWKRYFDQKAEQHGASVKTSDYFDEASFYWQRDQTLRWLGKLEGKMILDAGCGVGAFSQPLTAHNTVYGVDFSEKSLEFAAARGLQTKTGDLAALAFQDETFDLVLCIGVIQLIEQYATVVKELARVTKPGGILLIQTLHRGSMQRKLLRLFEHSKKFDKLYSMTELKQEYTQRGFEHMEFLKMYHPFQFVTSGYGEGTLDMLCTSFAIKGEKTK